jgi:hypothetical protein
MSGFNIKGLKREAQRLKSVLLFVMGVAVILASWHCPEFCVNDN